MKRILILAFIVSPFIFTECDFIKTKILGKESPADTMAAYQARLDSIRKADSLQQIQDSIAAVKAQERADSIAKADSIAEAEAARRERERNKYHVITGSFKTPKYAESYKQRMQQHFNYNNTKILQANNGFNLVSVSSFPTYGKALSQTKQIMNQGTLEAWVYKAN
jgi:cell division protein FtsN